MLQGNSKYEKKDRKTQETVKKGMDQEEKNLKNI
jgi:hypothetical protein